MEGLISGLLNNYLLINNSSKNFNSKMKKYVQSEAGWEPTSLMGRSWDPTSLMGRSWVPTSLLGNYYYLKKGDNAEERLMAFPSKFSNHVESSLNVYQKETKENPWVECNLQHKDDYSILERWFNETLEKWYIIEVFRNGVIRRYSFGFNSKVKDQYDKIKI